VRHLTAEERSLKALDIMNTASVREDKSLSRVETITQQIEEAEKVAYERGYADHLKACDAYEEGVKQGRIEGVKICAEELRLEHNHQESGRFGRQLICLTKAIQFERAIQGRAISTVELRIAAAIQNRGDDE